MKYHLESYLPIGAFKPRGGVFGGGGMALHGGGGGIIEDIGSGISDAVSSVGDAFSGAVESIGDLGQSVADVVSSAGVAVDNAVNDVVPGGWGTVAAVAVPFVAPYALGAAGLMEAGAALTAGEAAGVAAGTSAATGAIKGKSLEDTLKDAALSGATAYGLSSLGGLGTESGTVDKFGNTVEIGAPIPEPKVDTSSLEDSLKNVIDKTPTPIVSPETASNLAINSDADAYMRQFETAFSNPDVSLNGPSLYEPTAAVPSSDVPNPDLVQKAPAAFTPEQYQAQQTFQDLSEGSMSPAERLQSQYEAQDVMQQARDVNLPAGTPGSVYNPAASVPWYERLYDNVTNLPENAANYIENTSLSQMALDALPYGAGALGIAGLMGKGPLKGLGNLLGTSKLLGGGGGSSGGSGSSSKAVPVIPPKDYKYGSAGRMDPNYMLRNRINAGNVYSGATGYRPVTKMADGGEVKHFGLGGIADAFTQVLQPVEKAVVQPVGQAMPFLKDVAPYAGLVAAPFIASPAAAAGIGAIASGMGQGGFNLKRALMGGISAYGLSNMGGGLEAAASTEAPSVTKALEGSNDFFRDPSKMATGAGNLLKGGASYDLAAKNFGTQAGLPSAGMAIMGGTGIGAVNEGINQQAAADQALAQTEAAQNEKNAKTQAARDRAFAAIRANPYQYAMGGEIPNPPDDQTGIPNRSPLPRLEQGGPIGYAMGGYAMGGAPNVPRFLSGGGDGMSDSIKANIDGAQEARLADGEFVIPADVVSHLGNGSSKAGAKQLYSMMDRVRQARTGNKKQGKQINPRKLMAA